MPLSSRTQAGPQELTAGRASPVRYSVLARGGTQCPQACVKVPTDAHELVPCNVVAKQPDRSAWGGCEPVQVQRRALDCEAVTAASRGHSRIVYRRRPRGEMSRCVLRASCGALAGQRCIPWETSAAGTPGLQSCCTHQRCRSSSCQALRPHTAGCGAWGRCRAFTCICCRPVVGTRGAL